MLLLPNCKINIGLNVVARREDGYHNLETVFYPIPLRDNLEIKVIEDEDVPYRLNLGGIQSMLQYAKNDEICRFHDVWTERNVRPWFVCRRYGATCS